MRLDDATSPASLVAAAFGKRYTWTKWELVQALNKLDPGYDQSLLVAKLRARLMAVTFTDSAAFSYHEELYKKDAAPPPDDSADAEMLELLEELSFDYFANAKDLSLKNISCVNLVWILSVVGHTLGVTNMFNI